MLLLFCDIYSNYFKLFEFLQNSFAKESAGAYDAGNNQLLSEYLSDHSPDGKIIFLAANPDIPIKGLGTRLLNELQKRVQGKEIYLLQIVLVRINFMKSAVFNVKKKKDFIKIAQQKLIFSACSIAK